MLIFVELRNTEGIEWTKTAAKAIGLEDKLNEQPDASTDSSSEEYDF